MSDSTSIRAIVGRFSYDYSMKAVEDVFAKRPFDHCCIISTGSEPQYFTSIPREHQQWFISSDIRGCKYEGVDWNTLRALDEELIEGMRECEAVFMHMVYRLEWKRRISFDERKRMYYRHLRFWNDYILRNRINIYFSAWMPHEIPDSIIYYLCKYHGIPVLYFEAAGMVKDTSFAERSIEDSAMQIAPRYAELKKEYANIDDPDQIPLKERYDKRYKALSMPEGQGPPAEVVWPSYWKAICGVIFKTPGKAITILREYCTSGGLRRLSFRLQRYKRIQRKNAYYQKHAVEPDMHAPFVYFPLHYQPEVSTNPMGGGYADQILVAQMIAAHLPKGVLLYIKEHPSESVWLMRDVGYYKALLDIPNVRLVARHVDTFRLREHCKATATITGTAGFEAIFRGTPVLLFGHRFYQYADGVFPIRTSDDCKNAIKAIFEDGVVPTLKSSRLYMKAIEDTCVNGTLNLWHYEISDLPFEVHVESHANAMLAELDLQKEVMASIA